MQVEFHHVGTYKLKGVADNQTVLQINSAVFTNRDFPAKPASGKAEIVRPSLACPQMLSQSLSAARPKT